MRLDLASEILTGTELAVASLLELAAIELPYAVAVWLRSIYPVSAFQLALESRPTRAETLEGSRPYACLSAEERFI